MWCQYNLTKICPKPRLPCAHALIPIPTCCFPTSHTKLSLCGTFQAWLDLIWLKRWALECAAGRKAENKSCANSCCRFQALPSHCKHPLTSHPAFPRGAAVQLPAPWAHRALSGFMNSTLLSSHKGQARIRLNRFNFALVPPDTDPGQGNRFHHCTSCPDVTLPCSRCDLPLLQLHSWVLIEFYHGSLMLFKAQSRYGISGPNSSLK